MSEQHQEPSQAKLLEKENALLLEELHRVQEELERQLLYGEDCRRKIHELERKYQAACLVGRVRRTAWQRFTDWLGITQHRVINALRVSGEFDASWYRQQYPDVANSGFDPVEHYVRFGVKEGRNPSPYFDTRWYLQQYPDVAKKGMNPLLHYIRHGRKEGRQPGPAGLPAPADPFAIERKWLQQARDEQSRLAEERRGRIEALEGEVGALTAELHKVQEMLDQQRQAGRALEVARDALMQEKTALAKQLPSPMLNLP
ncbi:MAG: hypothetical protein DI596_11610 [Azospira oryzae]|nr:MAG: hypothetical protein DI596_11610 [Azospira oryzae]PZP77852.1 MAG: hypothetical protein DI593_11610 [Azospira oryzae]